MTEEPEAMLMRHLTFLALLMWFQEGSYLDIQLGTHVMTIGLN